MLHYVIWPSVFLFWFLFSKLSILFILFVIPMWQLWSYPQVLTPLSKAWVSLPLIIFLAIFLTAFKFLHKSQFLSRGQPCHILCSNFNCFYNTSPFLMHYGVYIFIKFSNNSPSLLFQEYKLYKDRALICSIMWPEQWWYIVRNQHVFVEYSSCSPATFTTKQSLWRQEKCPSGVSTHFSWPCSKPLWFQDSISIYPWIIIQVLWYHLSQLGDRFRH